MKKENDEPISFKTGKGFEKIDYFLFKGHIIPINQKNVTKKELKD